MPSFILKAWELTYISRWIYLDINTQRGLYSIYICTNKSSDFCDFRFTRGYYSFHQHIPAMFPKLSPLLLAVCSSLSQWMTLETITLYIIGGCVFLHVLSATAINETFYLKNIVKCTGIFRSYCGLFCELALWMNIW